MIILSEVGFEETLKKKRKSRTQLSVGRSLSFYEVVEKLRTRYTIRRSHPSVESMVYWGRPMSIFHVGNVAFSRVMEGAMAGDIHEVIYPKGYQCRCGECQRARTKNPRGPKRQPDGTILRKDFLDYDGALDFDGRDKLRHLVREPDGSPSFPGGINPK